MTITAVAAALLMVVGCGGGGTSLIGGSPSTASVVDAGQSLTLTATVVNDLGAAGVNWTLNGPGTLGGSQCAAVGTSSQCTNVYAAPATVSGPTSVTVTAASVHTPSQAVTFTITVNPALVITSAASLPSGVIAKPYTTTLTASGGTGTLTWLISSGSLPAGLVLNAATGIISGTPTVTGTFTFTIGLRDQTTVPATITQVTTLVTNPAPPVISTTTLPPAPAGLAYSQQLGFNGGTGTGTWSVVSGTLPAGVTLSASGLLSGTPALAAGGSTYNFAVQVVSGTQTSAAQTLSLTVTNPPVVTTTSLPNANTGALYTQQLAFSGGTGATPTWAITAGSLPSGLTLSTSGLISGTATALGTSTFSVAVTVGPQTSASQPLTLQVSNVSISSGTIASGEVGLPFNFKNVVKGGTAPYVWSLATGSPALPAGLTLNAASGTISGTPTAAGSIAVTLQVKDSLNSSATQALSITINAARTSAKNAALLGRYAFVLSGFDAAGAPAIAAGSFVADGAGNITNGVLDTNGTATTPALNQTLAISTYAIGADGRGKFTLTSGATSYSFVVSLRPGIVSAGGYITEFDTSGAALSGQLYLQDPTALTNASLNGGYAFGMSGFAQTANSHVGTVGELQLSGGFVNSGELVTSASGNAALVTSSGSYNVAANGRATATLALAGGPTISLVVYPVSAKQLLLFSANTSTVTTPVTTGQAFLQTIANGSFANSTLTGTAVSRTERTLALASGIASDVQLGNATYNGSGKVTFTGDENNAGAQSTVSSAGTYAVAANGRFGVQLSTGIGGCVDCASPQTIGYLSGVNQGFTLDFAASPATGTLEPQSLGALAGSFAAGTVQAPSVATTQAEGVVLVTGASAAYTVDSNTAGTLAADGSTTLSGLSNAARSVATATDGSTVVVYTVSPTRALVLNLSTSQPVPLEWQQ